MFGFAWKCSGSWTVRGETQTPPELTVVTPLGEQSQRQEQARGLMFDALLAAAQQERPDAQAVTVAVDEVEFLGRAALPPPSAFAA